MAVMFKVIDDKGEQVGDLRRSPGDASCEANRLTYETGVTHRAVRHIDQTEVERGRQREATRMRDGTYKPLPEWFPTKPEHYTHLARRDPVEGDTVYLAYSDSEAHLADDRQTRIAAGRYVARFFPDTPVREINDLTQRLLASMSNVTYAVTSDQTVIQEAFICTDLCNESSSSHSCMRHDFGVPRDKHPCNAYGGASDLHMAYLRNTDTGRIVARAIVWPARKTYVRVYGIRNADQQAMIRHLEADGYCRANGFAGARINIIPHPDQRQCYAGAMIPYIDGTTRAVRADDGILLDATPRNADRWYATTHTSGWACALDREHNRVEPPRTCDHCGAEAPRRDLYTVYDGAAAHRWCRTCADAHAVRDWQGYLYTPDVTMAEIVTYGAVMIRVAQFERSLRAFYCDFTHQWYDTTYFVSRIVHPPAEAPAGTPTQRWCRGRTPRVGTRAYYAAFGVPYPGRRSQRAPTPVLVDESHVVRTPGAE